MGDTRADSLQRHHKKQNKMEDKREFKNNKVILMLELLKIEHGKDITKTKLSSIEI